MCVLRSFFSILPLQLFLSFGVIVLIELVHLIRVCVCGPVFLSTSTIVLTIEVPRSNHN